MKFETQFDRRVSKGISFEGELKRTKDSFKAECDVNNIVAKYKKTGQLPQLAGRQGKYGDFSDVPSYQEALERVRVAQESFDALPAQVRAECGNDPATFLERVRDREWAKKHKLALPPSAPGLDATKGQPGGPVGTAATQPGASVPAPDGAKKSDTK